MTATAMVFDGPGNPLRAESFPLPELQPGELLVRVRGGVRVQMLGLGGTAVLAGAVAHTP